MQPKSRAWEFRELYEVAFRKIARVPTVHIRLRDEYMEGDLEADKDWSSQLERRLVAVIKCHCDAWSWFGRKRDKVVPVLHGPSRN